MSTDVKVKLPSYVRVEDVTKVIRALVVSTDGNEHPQVTIEHSYCVEMVVLHLKMDTQAFYDKVHYHTAYYHLEADTSLGEKMIYASSTGFWIGIAKGLVDFFGGVADFNDCDEIECDYYKPWLGFDKCAPNDGEDYTRFQQRISDVMPITYAQWQKDVKLSAYKS